MRGERTISELAPKHQLHPNQITQWKRKAVEKLVNSIGDRALPSRLLPLAEEL
ncbi:transposase [Devosia oryzisoli]|uniref:transposase n=1 Tax=Devosia oryzisoli TaxID=2774138 RepID=UPI003D10D29A